VEVELAIAGGGRSVRLSWWRRWFAAHARIPTAVITILPQLTSARLAVARWKSPVTATVVVSGWVQRVDSAPKGIAWHFDHGTTVLASGESFDDNLMPFEAAELSVLKGEYLNLEVGRAPTDPG
jgi:hypothetical protein